MPHCGVMTLCSVLLFLLLLLLSLCHCLTSTTSAPLPDSLGAEQQQTYDAISMLHLQLDDDADGQIDKSESDGFLREELHYVQGYGSRQDLLHGSEAGSDTAVSLRELWEHWRRSAVHNWTAEETADWLVRHVHLPQYLEVFATHHIAGPALPRLAVNNNHYLSGLGIKDPRHKQKIMLKAMDAVLFGPPKEPGNLVKDAILLTLVLVASVGCWLAYRQNQKFQARMQKMSLDMESLGKAEESLLELQAELDRANQEKDMVSSHNRTLEQQLTADGSASGDTELERLRAQVEILTEALRHTEAELEDRSWNCPPALQHWLQLTYELELREHTRKRIEAEKQLENAKLMCDKLRKKQNSLYGALVSTHGRTVNDVDTTIVHARRSLLEVTQELQERTHRWRQVELICGFQVVQNPGLPYLESLTRTLHRTGGSIPRTGSSLRKSDDDLDDDSVSTYGASATSGSTVGGISLNMSERGSGCSSARPLERDSSQSSHGSAPDGDLRTAGSIAAFAENFRPPSARPGPASVPGAALSAGPLAGPVAPPRSPALRRGNMVKSHSHDAAATSAQPRDSEAASRLAQSRSESSLDASLPAAAAAAAAQSQLGTRLRQLANTTAPVDEEDSTDTSSVAEDGERKTKKKFRLFRKVKPKPAAAAQQQ